MLKNNLINGILGGLCISIGGSACLSCENRYVGVVLFAVGLLAICSFGFSLYTGKIGYMVANHSAADIKNLAAGLLGNVIGCAFFGSLVGIGLPQLAESARALCDAKYLQSFPQSIIRAFFCGVLMYLAVEIYKRKQSLAGIFICVPAFALSGFEHSIANMFYFSIAGYFNFNTLLYILVIIIGNSLGGMFIPAAERIAAVKENVM